MDADKPAQRKSYAGNTTLEIFEVLWRHSYFGHGLTVRQILDELARKHQLEDPSELPTEKTIRNQLKKLTSTEFLGRHIGHLTESDLAGIECKNPQPGWYLDAFLSTAEMRLLLDSLTLSRISLDTMDDLIGKIRELAGAAGQARHAALDSLLALTLPDLDGTPQPLAQWKGKILVFNFWATWCPPCIKEIPAFSAASRKYQDKGVQFVGISIDTADNVRDYAQLEPIHPSMAGEDFCEFAKVTLPVFAFVGSNGQEGCADWHSPHFVGLDESIPTFVNFYVNTALRVLNELK